MNQNFFEDFGETAVQQQYGQEHFQSQDNAPDDEFQFSEPSHYVGIETIQQGAYSTNTYQPDLATINKIQEEQDRINAQLREKSSKEYEAKQRRKEEGRKQLEEFMRKKEQQVTNRKQENIQKQKQLLANNAKLTQQAGWKKVAANVPLKQGEQKGTKDITRMRQSIINKKNDEAI